MKRARLLPHLAWGALAAAAAASWPTPRPGTLGAAAGALLLYWLGRRLATPRWAPGARAMLPVALALLFADSACDGEAWRHGAWLALLGLSVLLSVWSAIERARAGRRWLEGDADRAAAALLLAAPLCLTAAMGLLYVRSTLPIPPGSAGVLAALAAAAAGWWGLRDEAADERPWPRVLALSLAGLVLVARAVVESWALFG